MIFFPVGDEEGLRTGEAHAKGREKQEAARGIPQTLARLCSSPQLHPYVQEQDTSKHTESTSGTGSKCSFSLNLLVFCLGERCALISHNAFGKAQASGEGDLPKHQPSVPSPSRELPPVSHTPHLSSVPVQQDHGLSCCCTCRGCWLASSSRCLRGQGCAELGAKPPWAARQSGHGSPSPGCCARGQGGDLCQQGWTGSLANLYSDTGLLPAWPKRTGRAFRLLFLSFAGMSLGNGCWAGVAGSWGAELPRLPCFLAAHTLQLRQGLIHPHQLRS